MSYIVKAPLVGVNGADGKVKYLYIGTPVPSDVSAEDLERLEEGGLIVKDESTARPKVAAKKPAGDSSDGAA